MYPVYELIMDVSGRSVCQYQYLIYFTVPSQNSDFLMRALRPGNTGCENVKKSDEVRADKAEALVLLAGMLVR